MRRPRVAAAAAFACVAAVHPCAFGADSVGTAIDDTVVVTATRDAQPAFEVLAPVIVIDRERIERSLAPDVADLLRFHAGLELARNGGPGQATSLFIRGTESNHAVVLVDGVRINPGTIGGAALQNIAPELVERIEIVKGPRSTLYGTDAIGGVINLITRRGGASGFDVLAGAGRYGARQLQAAGRLVGAAGEVSLAAHSTTADGFPTRTGDDVDRGYRNRSLSFAARGAAGPVELGARLWRASGNTEYSDFFLTPVDQDFANSAAAIEAGWSPTEALRTRLTLSRVLDDLRQVQAPDFATTRRHALDWQNDLRLGAHALTAGALLTRETTRTGSFGAGFDVATAVDTFFLQDQMRVGSHRLLLAAGWTDHEDFGGHGTWHFEYGRALGVDTKVTAAAGTAFRAPDATDRYGFGGNPALDPERSRNLELGIRHRVAPGHVLALAAFDNRIDDLVQFVTLSFDPFRGENRNVDRARIRGVEATWAYETPSFEARASAILQRPEDRSDGSRLLRRADQSYTLGLARRFATVEVGADVLVSGDRVDFGFPAPVRLGGYTLVNLHARWTPTRALTLQARLENATDRRYALADGFNTMRRAVMVAARYGFAGE